MKHSGDVGMNEKRRNELRLWAIRVAGGCGIQEGAGDDKVYPCGTCFNVGLSFLVDGRSKIYKEHNEPVDRINEVWRYLLQIRDMDYKTGKKVVEGK